MALVSEYLGDAIFQATGIPCRGHTLRHASSHVMSRRSNETFLLLIDYASIAPEELLSEIADIVDTFNTPPYLLFHVPQSVQHDAAVELVLQACRGIVFRDSPASVIVQAAQAVIGGELWFPRPVLERALASKVANNRPRCSGADTSGRRNGAGRLTRREREILSLAVEGRSNAEMSAILGISGNTVKTHLASLYRKIKVSNRVQAVFWVNENRHALLPSSAN